MSQVQSFHVPPFWRPKFEWNSHRGTQLDQGQAREGPTRLVSNLQALSLSYQFKATFTLHKATILLFCINMSKGMED